MYQGGINNPYHFHLQNIPTRVSVKNEPLLLGIPCIDFRWHYYSGECKNMMFYRITTYPIFSSLLFSYFSRFNYFGPDFYGNWEKPYLGIHEPPI